MFPVKRKETWKQPNSLQTLILHSLNSKHPSFKKNLQKNTQKSLGGLGVYRFVIGRRKQKINANVIGRARWKRRSKKFVAQLHSGWLPRCSFLLCAEISNLLAAAGGICCFVFCETETIEQQSSAQKGPNLFAATKIGRWSKCKRRTNELFFGVWGFEGLKCHLHPTHSLFSSSRAFSKLCGWAASKVKRKFNCVGTIKAKAVENRRRSMVSSGILFSWHSGGTSATGGKAAKVKSLEKSRNIN